MPIGIDQQYNESWYEQDKIRRRLELKHRLKEEGIRKRYDPFLQMKKVIFTDPAVDRYMDFRKKGRLPGSPLAPKMFFMMLGMTFLPIIGLTLLIDMERAPWLEKRSKGEIPYSEIEGKSVA